MTTPDISGEPDGAEQQPSDTPFPFSVSLPEIMKPRRLAEHLDVPLSTLYKWRYRGEGPPGIKIGGHVRYRRSDVERWLADHEEGGAR